MRLLKKLLTPLLIFHYLVYGICESKKRILEDANRFLDEYGFISDGSDLNVLTRVLLFCPEFRNIFYVRTGAISKKLHIGFLMEIVLPRYKFLSIGTRAENIGGGLFIQHGNSTIIHAESIGENCWVNQNVTIGDSGKGIPVIGNNVRICTGAVVLGPIKIGDNAIIGANATVVKDVPANCTVVPSPSYIMKNNGVRVQQKL
ncbi:MAG: serine acetyltransferase [Sideroxydans sp.]|nr:serine acetyltransferase [Sideroxydans sp.]